jgi:PAS domain S-box-containing protein
MIRSAPVPTGVERTFPENQILVSKNDLDWKITYVNEAFLRATGYTEDEVLGQTHEMFLNPGRPRGLGLKLREIEKAGGEIYYYIPYLAKNGDHVWVFSNQTPILDASGRNIGDHSTDRAPDRETVPVISAFYDRLAAEERRHGGGEAGAAAGLRLLNQILDEKGFSYDEFVWSITSEDMR